MDDSLYEWRVWNSYWKEFQFGIAATTKKEAQKALEKKIGRDASLPRFSIRKVKKTTPLKLGGN
jgi:DNA/RNA-binding domain of Phe-tRNA-synthetase-like protein